MKSCGKRILFFMQITMVVGIILTVTTFSFANAPQCSQIFIQTATLNKGSSLGPIEFILNIKQKFWQSKYLKNFDTQSYQEHFEKFQSNKEALYSKPPQSIEEFAALIDSRIENMQISTQQMPPVLRAKVYKILSQILEKGEVNQKTNTQQIVDRIFRGNFKSQDRLINLITTRPNEASANLFAEQVYLVTLYDTIHEAISYQPGPIRPGFFSLKMPRFLKNHKEEAVASLWLGTEVVFAVTANPGEFGLESVYLPEFQIFKMKKYNDEIHLSIEKNGLDATYDQLLTKYSNERTWNYYTSVVRKSLNTYFWISMGILFL